MTVLTSVLGYSALGFFTRCYALGIQRRNVFENLGGHAALMTLFGGVGYYFHDLEKRQNKLIALKKEEILENRRKFQERMQQKLGSSSDGDAEGADEDGDE